MLLLEERINASTIHNAMSAMICGMSNFIGGCSEYNNSLLLAKPILARKRCSTSDDNGAVRA